MCCKLRSVLKINGNLDTYLQFSLKIENGRLDGARAWIQSSFCKLTLAKRIISQKVVGTNHFECDYADWRFPAATSGLQEKTGCLRHLTADHLFASTRHCYHFVAKARK